jgi:hypothetical protein
MGPLWLAAMGSSLSVDAASRLVWCHSSETDEPAVIAQTSDAAVVPPALQAISDDVTSVTGLLFGGERMQVCVPVLPVASEMNHWRVVWATAEFVNSAARAKRGNALFMMAIAMWLCWLDWVKNVVE